MNTGSQANMEDVAWGLIPDAFSRFFTTLLAKVGKGTYTTHPTFLGMLVLLTVCNKLAYEAIGRKYTECLDDEMPMMFWCVRTWLSA